MNPIYSIKDWAVLYETHETRKLKKLSWIPVRNNHDGLPYKRISKMEKKCEIFTAWILTLQIASKCDVRGVLVIDGFSLTPDDAADMTGFPANLFEISWPILSSKNIGWMLCDDKELQESPGVPGNNPGTSGKSPGTPPLNGMERKKEKKEKKSTFVPPCFLEDLWPDYLKTRSAKHAAKTETAFRGIIHDLEKMAPGDTEKQRAILEQSIKCGWTGVFPLKQIQNNNDIERHNAEAERRIQRTKEYTRMIEIDRADSDFVTDEIRKITKSISIKGGDQ